MQIFVFAFVISVLAGAAGSKSKSWDFAAVWQMLLTLGYSIGGTLILRKVCSCCLCVSVCILLSWGAHALPQPAMRSALNIGFMIAVSFFLSMQLLVLAVLSVGNLALFGDGSAPSSEKAVAAFSVILFLGFVRDPMIGLFWCIVG